MATFRPELHSIEAVVNFYDLHNELTKYRIYAGHKIEEHNVRFEYLDEDKNQGRDLLTENLLSIAQNPNNSNVYILQVLSNKLPTDRKGGKNPQGSYSITFQLNSNSAIQPMQHISGTNTNDRKLWELEQKIERLTAMLETDPEPELEVDPEPIKPTEQIIGAILQNEAVQNQIIPALVGKLLNWLTPPEKKTVAISGVPNEDQNKKALAAIDILKNHSENYGDHLLKLASIAENNPAQFQMLLSMLKNF